MLTTAQYAELSKVEDALVWEVDLGNADLGKFFESTSTYNTDCLAILHRFQPQIR